MTASRQPYLCYLAAFMVLSAGCQSPESRREYLARVGDSYLTRKGLEAVGDSFLLASETGMREYVALWVSNELLYLEARRQGMENAESFERQLQEARRRLAIEALLQKNVYGDTIDVPEDSIRAYFVRHQDDFVIRDDLAKLNMVAFASREKANRFRSIIAAGNPWAAAMGKALDDSATRSSILTRVDERYYTRQTLFPPELWRVAANLGPGETSFAVRSQGAFFVIQLLTAFRKGAQADLALVREEIRQRLLVRWRQQQYDQFLTQLRTRYQVEVALP